MVVHGVVLVVHGVVLVVHDIILTIIILAKGPTEFHTIIITTKHTGSIPALLLIMSTRKGKTRQGRERIVEIRNRWIRWIVVHLIRMRMDSEI